MTKCFWCQATDLTEKQGLSENPKITLHLKCFDQIMSIHDKIEMATEYLQGRLPRLSENGNKIGYDTIEQCLKSMDDFDKQWAKKMAIIKQVMEKKVELPKLLTEKEQKPE